MTENKEQVIQVSAPVTPVTQLPNIKDITKARVIKWLTFEGRDWEDVFFSSAVHLSLPMFLTSVLVSNTVAAKMLFIPCCIICVLLISIYGWLVHEFPQMQALVWGRVVIVGIGILLGSKL